MPISPLRVVGRPLLALVFLIGGLLPAAAQTPAPNVGIGTTAPTQTLDVNGSLRVRGLSGSDTRLPVVLPDGTLSVSAPYGTTAVVPAFPTAATGSVFASTYPYAIAVSGTRAYVTMRNSNELKTFDVSNPAAPVLLGTSGTTAQPQAIALNGTRAFVTTANNFLIVYDISGNMPLFLGFVATGTDPRSVAVNAAGTRAYVANAGSGSLQVFDISTNTPALLGNYTSNPGLYAVAVSGNRAYTINLGQISLQVFDISTNTPVLLGSATTDIQPYALALSGTRAYVANGQGSTLQVFDVSNAAAPALLGRATLPGTGPRNVAVSGTTAYVVNQSSNSLQVFDASTATAPNLLGTVSTDGAPQGLAVNAAGNTAYVGTGNNRLQTFVFPAVPRGLAVNPDGSLTSAPLPSGTQFVQNQTSLQSGANFNVGGNGYVGGRVGIGTTSPGHPLTVQADAGSRLLGFNASTGTDKYNWSLTNGGLNLSESNVAGERLFIQDGGRVGIGTSSPGQKLEVAGQIFSNSGGFRFPDNTVQTTAATDDQSLSLTGQSLSISNGNTVTLPADTDAQTLGISGSTITISGSNSSVTVPSSADNLGNHTATTNVGLSGNWLSNAPANANGLRVDNAGNVGIGVAAPTQRLDVDGGILARAYGPVSNQGAYLQWNRSGGDGETWLLNQQGGGGANAGIRFGGVTTGNAVTEWGRFVNNGALGIGTPAPATTLDVRTADNSAAITVGKTDNTAGALYFGNVNHGLKRNYNGSGNDLGLFTTAGNLYLSASNTAPLTNQFVLNTSGNVGLGTATPLSRLSISQATSQSDTPGQTLGELTFVGFNRTVASASILAQSPGFDDVSHLIFKTSPSGTGAVERVRIEAGGNVGIGTTAPSQKLDIDGNVRVRGLSGTDTRLPVVLPDGTLSVNAPVYSTATTTPALPAGQAGAIGTGDQPEGVAVSGTLAYVVNYGSNTLQLFNCANPASPVLLSTTGTAASPISVALVGTTAYVACFTGDVLQAFNCSNPASPVLVGTVGTNSDPIEVAISGTTAYVVSYTGNTVQAFNVANPASPVALGFIGTGINPGCVAVSGTTVYVGKIALPRIFVADFSNPASPVSLTSISTTGTSVTGLAVTGNRLYATVTGSNMLDIFDCSNPASLGFLGRTGTAPDPRKVVVSGNRAYVIAGASNSLEVFDVAVSTHPTQLRRYLMGGGSYPRGVALGGAPNYPTAYVTNFDSDMLRIFSFTGPARVVGVNADGSLASLPLPSGVDFIQNQTSAQAGANFNVGGTGTVGGLLTAGSATVSGGATVAGNVGIGTTTPSQKLDVRGNLRLGDNASNATGTGQTIEFVGPGLNTDPVGLYRVNTATDASELRVVVGDGADANDKFVVGRSTGSAEGTLATGTFTPGFTVRGDGSVAATGSATLGGPVGIGVSSPLQTLDVNGGILARSSERMSTQGTYLQWNRSGSEGETWLLNQKGSGLGGIRFGNTDAVSTGANGVTEWARFDSDGRFGVGTIAPIAQLHVRGSRTALTQGGGGYTFFNPGTGVGTSPLNGGQAKQVAAYFEGGEVWINNFVVAGALQTTSDRRIKNIIGLSDRAADLALLNKLRITDYTYIDGVNHVAGQVVKKVIAQEVEEVLPAAVSRSFQALPNVYERATKVSYANGQVTVTTAKPHELPVTGGRLRLYTPTNAELNPDVTVVDAHTVRFASAEAYADGLFVYGKYVDDFRAVDYDALTTLNVSATQELARKVAALEAQNAALKASAAADNAHTTATLESLADRLRALEAGQGQARK